MLPFSGDSSELDTAGNNNPSNTGDASIPTRNHKISLTTFESPTTSDHGLSDDGLFRHFGGGLNVREHEDRTTDFSRIEQERALDEATSPDPEGELSLPLQSLRVQPTVPLPDVLSSVSSATGASLSLPPDAMSSMNLSQSHQSGDFEQYETLPNSANEGHHLFPWRYQFEWKDASLLFAGEPFGVNEAVKPSTSRLCSASGSEPTMVPEPRPSSHVGPTSIEMNEGLLFGMGSGSFPEEVLAELHDIEDEELDTAAPDSTLTFLALETTIDCLVRVLLYDYLRSHAPQKTDKHKKAQPASDRRRDGETAGTTNGRVGKPSKRPNRRNRRHTVDGNEESEDENAHPEDWSSNPSIHLKKKVWAACPFLRRDFDEYQNTCIRKLTTITRMKDHLRNKHYRQYCASCYQVFGMMYSKHGVLPEIPTHDCKPRSTAPIDLLTHEKYKAIKGYADRTKSFEEQLDHYFSVLFPGERAIMKRMLAPFAVMQLERAEDYLDSDRVHALINETLEREDCKKRDRKHVVDVALGKFNYEIIRYEDARSASGGKTDRDAESIRGEHSSLPGDIDPSTAQKMDAKGTPQAFECAQTYHSLDGSGESAYGDGPFGDQQTIVGGNGCFRDIDEEVPWMPMFEANNSSIPNTYSDHLTEAELFNEILDF
ncbi:hypothetical protein S40293_03289 [Stachybotrys chartarum IBT 40293]|nr:hypothetical protein S40293_03289 [Stachybotrys chartarum IBT 40293]